MTIYQGMLLGIALAAATSSAWAAPAHYPISTEQVAATINETGMAIRSDQVTLLSEVVATTTAPVLKVRSIQPWGSEKMMARVECANSAECIPFFVSVRVSESEQAQAALSLPGPATSAAALSRTPVVRNGSPVTLELEGKRVHIRLSVICLERGVPGQTIRASSPDHRIVYRAQVIDGSLLKGTL
jgi:hypothetical protein